MSKLGKFKKQTAEIETYSISYNDDMEAGDNLETPTVTIVPSGLTLDYANVIDTPTDKRVKMKFSGGTDGVEYKITVQTPTSDGRLMEDEFYIKIKDE